MDDSTREQIERARNQSGGEKMRESLQVFERNSRMMRDGIRHQFPHLSEQQLLQKLYEYLAINRELEFGRARK